MSETSRGPAGSPSPHAILLLSAMGVPEHYYERLVGQWRARGIPVTRLSISNPRGSRTARLAGADRGYAAYVEERIPAAYRAAGAASPGSTVVVVGHSLGGQLGLIAASRHFPAAPMALIASGTAHHRAFPVPRRVLYLLGSQAIGAIAALRGEWPGDRLGFGGRQSAALMADWAANVRTGRYRVRGGSFDYDASLAAFRGPLLVVHIDDDRLAPPNAADRPLAKAPAARQEHVVYRATRGAARPGAHFTWARDDPGVVPAVDAWMARLRADPPAEPEATNTETL